MQGIVLAGHSTGCQDVVRYVTKEGIANIAGVVLQAAVRFLPASVQLDDEQYDAEPRAGMIPHYMQAVAGCKVFWTGPSWFSDFHGDAA